MAGAGGGDEFGYDEGWDGDWDIDRSLLDDDDEDGFGGESFNRTWRRRDAGDGGGGRGVGG